MIKLLIGIMALSLVSCSPAMAELNNNVQDYKTLKVNLPKSKGVSSEIDFERLADCIHRVENGSWAIGTGKGEQYGIHSVHYANSLEARHIAIRTARHAYNRYLSANRLKTTKTGYISYLSKVYCPVNHNNWERMVSYYYGR